MSSKKQTHHGGAWKVAYADFVTAMMALFMVLWISNQEREVLIATSQYFQNPFRAPTEATSGVLPFNTQKAAVSKGRDQGTDKESERRNQISLTFLNSVAADFYRLLHLDEDLQDKPIDIQVTSDGLRITLFDRSKRSLFAGDSVALTEWGKFVLQNLAWLIERHRFRVTIDGHTRAGRTVDRPSYSAWELSADRANAARRSLVFYAVDPTQIERVTGYADTHPLPNQRPEAEANDRLTLSLTLKVRGAFKDKKLVDPPVPTETVPPSS